MRGFKYFCVCWCARISRNIETDKRVVLAMMVVDESIPHCLYYSRSAPQWARGNLDRVYKCTAVDKNGAALRDAEARMAEMTERRKSLVPSLVEEVAKATWLATFPKNGRMPAMKMRYALRTRARYHSVTGPNQISLEERIADFKSRVLMGRTFATFPSDDGPKQVAVAMAGIKKIPGRNFSKCSIKPGTKMRKWFDQTMGR